MRERQDGIMIRHPEASSQYHQRQQKQQQQQRQRQQRSMWLWRSDYETWETFDQEEMAKIQKAHNACSNGLVLERGDAVYYIDLAKNTQTNTTTGRMRLLQHVPSGSRWVHQATPSSSALITDDVENQGTSDKSGPWTAFSTQEAARLEEALFARNDCVILERGAETLYVDFQRWIMTDLARHSTRNIQLVDSSTVIENPKPVAVRASATDPKKEIDARVLLSSSVTKSPPAFASMASTWQEGLLGKAVTRTSWMRSSDGSERTCSTTSTGESDSSVLCEASDEDLAAPFKNRGSGSDDVLWLWRDNQGLWSTFEEQEAVAIEGAFAKGETGVVMQRGGPPEPSASSNNGGDESTTYFLDLIDMTQTNLQTGFVRNIERREHW